MAQVTLRRPDRPKTPPGLSPVGALVRRHDRDRFQTALFAPVAAREALFALYAFNYEIARVRERVREPMLGQIRLQWWREAIDTAYAGTTPRRHEVVEPLTAAIRSHELSRAPFEQLIAARERGLESDPPATPAAVEAYAEASSVPLVVLALEVLGAATPAACEVARHIGIAYAQSGILRALPHEAASGRSPLPGGPEARDRAALREAVKAVAASAAAHLKAARARRREVPAQALPALLPARIATAALRRLARAGYDPFAPRFGDHDPLTPWRLAAAALFGRF